MNIKTKFAALLLFVPTFTHSIGGLGDVVTDPTSYAYYANQLKQGVEMLEFAEKKIQTAVDTYNKVTSLEENITGNFKRATKSLKKIKELQNLSSRDLKKSLKFAKKAIEEIEDIPEYKEDIGNNIDDVFGNEEKKAPKTGGWVSVSQKRKQARQQSYKQALVDSELTAAKIEMQLEKMEELASATNETTSLKDSTDVTNTILLEMLENQREMIKHMSNTSRNLSMAYYNGLPKPQRKIPQAIKNPYRDNVRKDEKIQWKSPFFNKSNGF